MRTIIMPSREDDHYEKKKKENNSCVMGDVFACLYACRNSLDDDLRV